MGLVIPFLLIVIALILLYLVDVCWGISLLFLLIVILQCIKFCMNGKDGKKMKFKRAKVFSHYILRNNFYQVRNSDPLSDIGFQMLIYIILGIFGILSIGAILFYSLAKPYINLIQSTYIVKDNRLNLVRYFTISNNPRLTEIRIGSNCFKSAKTFKVESLYLLKTFTIGSNSFTKHKNSCDTVSSKSFHISNCVKLQSIEIGQYSFSDYVGDFELINLPILQSIKIGSNNHNSYNFYSSLFIIQSN